MRSAAARPEAADRLGRGFMERVGSRLSVAPPETAMTEAVPDLAVKIRLTVILQIKRPQHLIYDTLPQPIAAIPAHVDFINMSRSRANGTRSMAFVSMSACCSAVFTYWIFTVPSLTSSRMK
jgi:hypothetical protein